jgi:hypothetical protein
MSPGHENDARECLGMLKTACRWIVVLTAFFVLGVFCGQCHAGWLKAVCEKYLVADDPYQFETYSEQWVIKHLQSLRIKEAWGKASDNDLTMIVILEKDLERREWIRSLK